MIGRAFAYYALYRALTGRPLRGKPRPRPALARAAEWSWRAWCAHAVAMYQGTSESAADVMTLRRPSNNVATGRRPSAAIRGALRRTIDRRSSAIPALLMAGQGFALAATTSTPGGG